MPLRAITLLTASASRARTNQIGPNSATAGGAGFTLTVNGTNFTSGTTVQWGTTVLATAYVNTNQVTATVPANLITNVGTVNITVTAPGGTSAATMFIINPAGGTTATATFVALDTTTQGNWSTAYGSQGYNIVNYAVSYPSYVTGDGLRHKRVHLGAVEYRWAGIEQASASDGPDCVNVVQRIVFCDRFNDGAQHRVAVYCLDWDSTTWAESITIQDGNGVVLNTQNVTGFHNGQYLVWQLTGHFRILVTNNTGANAVVSGLFFN